ncbi:MAG: response regulator transcription factor [Acetivibrionales bacterium]|jgi:DNA-binding CsgD family transcriptional regulator
MLYCRDLWNRIKKLSKEGRTLRRRLIVFSALFIITFIIAVFSILLISGVFKIGNKETKTLFENELNHIANDIYKDYGSIAVKSVDLAKVINKNIEVKLESINIKAGDLINHPETYNELLESECQTLITALLRTKSSGVFIILDGTINPKLPNSDFSKSGVYIRNMEPNIVNLESPYLHMLRGSTKIAKSNDILIHSQWAMEFNIEDADYFTKTIDYAKSNDFLPLSKLYYWCPNTSLPDTTDKVMLCSVPLIASDGEVYGVCGFEVSSLLFKLSYSPDTSISGTVFSLLSRADNRIIDCSSSFMAAEYSAVVRNELTNAKLICHEYPDSLNKYFSPSNQFMGIHKNLALYPKDSPYNDEKWIVSLMVPIKDYEKTIDNINQRLIFLFLGLLFAGIIASFWFSKIYLKPITETFRKVKQSKPSEIEKTNILEIDDLLEFLSQQDDKAKTKVQKKETSVPGFHNTGMFKKFLKNIDTLSPAERAVFDLYMEGCTAKEIAERLYLSINTIKTHNKRIYEKMNVSSRNELMVYINMMKEMDSKG